MKNFVKYSEGTLYPLIIDASKTNHTSIFNPSIFDTGSHFIINIRHCQYAFLHSELQKYEHEFGPLVYLHPENDMTLTTKNFVGHYDYDLNIIHEPTMIDMSNHDVAPLWTFIGLEDARVVNWNDKLYLTGVRRDTTTNGEGRMELSEVVDFKEVSRKRIPAPFPDKTYCEKNWMPIINKPFHYVKWTNPTEVVVYHNGETETVSLSHDNISFPYDLRGGSQVIPFENDTYIAVLHVVDLFKSEAGRKNAVYQHVFVQWNKGFEILKISPIFSFMSCSVEFCAGLAIRDDHFYISYGAQDNAAYVLKCHKDKVKEFLYS